MRMTPTAQHLPGPQSCCWLEVQKRKVLLYNTILRARVRG